jgi:hypothetical protein
MWTPNCIRHFLCIDRKDNITELVKLIAHGAGTNIFIMKL